MNTVLAVAVLFSAQSSSSGAPSDLPSVRRACDDCGCDLNVVPYFVDCSARQLKTVFADWSFDANASHAREIALDVDYSDNRITELALFPALPVHTLTLRGNLISKIADSAFENLFFLTYIDLSGNQLDSIKAETFNGISTLLELNLASNRLTSLSSSAFKYVQSIEVLVLDGNPLKSLDESTTEAIQTLVSLKTLSLATAGLKTLPDAFLTSLRTLNTLDLSGNALESMPRDLKQLSTLKSLDISENPLASLDLNTFLGLSGLTTLRVTSMPNLTRIEDATFSPLFTLEDLFLQHNAKLSFIHPDAFDALPAENFTLRKLYLNGNALRYIPHQLLPLEDNWAKLDVIDLRDNPWACDCHNEWMADDVLRKVVSRRSPELIGEVVCRSPVQLAGRRMIDLDAGEFPCDPTDNFFPYSTNMGVTKRSRPRSSGKSQRDKLATGVGLTCFVTVLVSALFAAGLEWQRRRQMRYRKMNNVVYERGVGEDNAANIVTDRSDS